MTAEAAAESPSPRCKGQKMKHISDVLKTALKRRAVLVREQASQIAIIAEEHELDLRAAIDGLDECATRLEVLASPGAAQIGVIRRRKPETAI